MLKHLGAAALLFAAAAAASKSIEVPDAEQAIQRRMVLITSELRCLVCQNQTIADSHSALASDLRGQVMERVRAGDSDRQILDYMTARYGDFILYRPPVKAATAVLWLAPGLLLAGGGLALVLALRRRAGMAPAAFEPDPPGSAEPEPEARLPHPPLA